MILSRKIPKLECRNILSLSIKGLVTHFLNTWYIGVIVTISPLGMWSLAQPAHGLIYTPCASTCLTAWIKNVTPSKIWRRFWTSSKTNMNVVDLPPHHWCRSQPLVYKGALSLVSHQLNLSGDPFPRHNVIMDPGDLANFLPRGQYEGHTRGNSVTSRTLQYKMPYDSEPLQWSGWGIMRCERDFPNDV